LQVVSGSAGIVDASGGTQLTNQGMISGDSFGTGLRNDSSISSLTNSGTISGGNGIQNSYNSYLGTTGTITSLTNTGLISGSTAAKGIYDYFGSLGTLTNSGAIIGENDSAVINTAEVDSIVNNSSGNISGAVYGLANITSRSGGTGTINSIDNSGTISGNSGGIYNSGTIKEITNSGDIFADDTNVGFAGIENFGTISGSTTGIHNTGSISGLINSGTISGTSKAIYSTSGELGSITNSGVIDGRIVVMDQDLTILGGTELISAH
jgi:hypothetical protein